MISFIEKTNVTKPEQTKERVVESVKDKKAKTKSKHNVENKEKEEQR